MKKLTYLLIILLLITGCTESENYLEKTIKILTTNDIELTLVTKNSNVHYAFNHNEELIELLNNVDASKPVDTVLLATPSDIITFTNDQKLVKIELYAIEEKNEDDELTNIYYCIGIGYEKSAGYTYKYFMLSEEQHLSFIKLIEEAK